MALAQAPLAWADGTRHSLPDQDWWISAGPALSASSMGGWVFGAGAEVTGGYVLPRSSLFFGGLAQAQWMGRAGVRLMAGGQLNWGFLGIELGLADQLDVQRGGQTYFAHIAPFLTLGVTSVALRVAVPLLATGPAGTALPMELGGVLTFKWPFHLPDIIRTPD